MKILVCGGRNYDDVHFLSRTLDGLHKKHTITEVIHGAAKGADSLAADWARYHGIKDNAFQADWDRLGKGAGPARNTQMLKEGKPDMVVAFKGGSGTINMITQAMNADVPVWIPARRK